MKKKKSPRVSAMSEEEEGFDMTMLKDIHAQHTSKKNFTIQHFVSKWPELKNETYLKKISTAVP